MSDAPRSRQTTFVHYRREELPVSYCGVLLMAGEYEAQEGDQFCDGCKQGLEKSPQQVAWLGVA